MIALLAVAERVVNDEARALAPVAGWLLLAAALALAVLGVVHRAPLRALWFRLEDPRPMAVFRIAFGLCCLGCVNGLWDLFDYLFTDEGLFPAEIAREVFAAEQFAGFGNGLGDDPRGFFDARAVWTWCKGPRYSLLFFWDSPGFFWAHLVAFEIAMVCLVVGFQTRWTKWVAWFLFHSIIGRNNVFWEGTENVYRTFFFYLCLARCDRAFSIDNWLRVRRMRKAGTDGPIHRRIPAWPRLLVILQCVAIYTYTGAVKNGAVWWAGDALYYAISLDHFHRVPPQPVAAVLGTNLFRLATHVVHAWETLFGLVAVGLWIRFVRRAGLDPPRGPAVWIGRSAWLALVVSAAALVWWVYPVHHAATASGPSLLEVRLVFLAVWFGGAIVIAWGYVRLRDRPPRVAIGGRRHTLDLEWLCRWFLGRRLWLGLGVVFHLNLIVFMNIGWFSPGCLTGFICFLGGPELAAIGRRALRRPPTSAPTTVEARAIEPGGDAPRLAYGRLGRLCIGALSLYHVVGVAVWLLPDKDCFHFRTAATRPFSWWLRTTQTSQGWKMFAPSPPRRSVMLRVLVTDASGQQWDMNTDVYAPAQRPIPWIAYTRARKINRRIAGGEGSGGQWYQKWHARWWCRRWIVEHGGEIPRAVELIEVSYPIPTPEWLRDHGPYDPAERLRAKGTQKSLHVVDCATEPEARPSAEVMARHGLAPIDDPIPRWSALRGRLRAWKKRSAAQDAADDAPED